MVRMQKQELNPRYTFDNYVIGESNSRAMTACYVAISESIMNFEAKPLKRKNPLFLCGNPGVGKTHLMQALAHQLPKINDSVNVLYVTSEQFVNELIDSLRNRAVDEFREKYTNVDVLLMDDIQFISHKEGTQQEFLRIFDILHTNNKQMIFSTCVPLKAIKGINDKLMSGFKEGVSVSMPEPDYETRMSILKQKAQRDDLMYIPDEILTYVADNITGNVRALEGALNKLAAYFKVLNKRVTLENAKECLADLINEEK